MAGGIKITKNYVTTGVATNTLANNWSALVLGVTSRGPQQSETSALTEATLVRTYAEFVDIFGEPVVDEDTGVELPTHANVKYVLSYGVPVLFKRIFVGQQYASYTFMNTTDSKCIILAGKNYTGTSGNNISFKVIQNESNAGFLKIYEKSSTQTEEVSSLPIGVVTYNTSGVATTTLGDLLFNYINNIVTGKTSFDNKYIQFSNQCMLGTDAARIKNWSNLYTTTSGTAFESSTYELSGGEQETENKLSAAINILKNPNSIFWQDKKLINASVYYPQLRLLTTGGIIAATTDEQKIILTNLGQFAMNCEKSFRVLVDFDLSIDTTETPTISNVVRGFIRDLPSTIDPAVYSYVGGWGTDSNNNWLPGSTGMLASLGRSGYNVYSRRIAGTAYNPGFTKAYDTLYVDIINDWQDEYNIQLNPIVNIDSQGNLAIMGSSTLALPTVTGTRNPEQALDVVMVGDYIAAILNNIALAEIESALDRLSLNALNNNMSSALEAFVTSRAITRYDLSFDTTQLGKLGVDCVIYFAIGLEEVSLNITSVYDTTVL